MNDNKHWFKRRRYGYGWRPVTWQGWLAISAYLLIVIGGVLTLRDVPEGEFSSEVGVYLLVVLLATFALLRVSYKHGPRPKWRWGQKPGDDSSKDF